MTENMIRKFFMIPSQATYQQVVSRSTKCYQKNWIEKEQGLNHFSAVTKKTIYRSTDLKTDAHTECHHITSGLESFAVIG